MALLLTGTETVAELNEAISYLRDTIKTFHTAPPSLRDTLDDLLDAKNDLKENDHGR